MGPVNRHHYRYRIWLNTPQGLTREGAYTLKWNSVAGAARYVIELRSETPEATVFGRVIISGQSGGEPPTTVTIRPRDEPGWRLQPYPLGASSLSAVIRAEGHEAAASAWSAGVSVPLPPIQMALGPVLGTPEGLELSATNTLRWNRVIGAARYVIELRSSETPEATVFGRVTVSGQSGGEPPTTATIVPRDEPGWRLQPYPMGGTFLSAVIRAEGVAAASYWSAGISVPLEPIRMATGPILPTPTGFKLSDANSLQWSGVAGAARYIIELRSETPEATVFGRVVISGQSGGDPPTIAHIQPRDEPAWRLQPYPLRAAALSAVIRAEGEGAGTSEWSGPVSVPLPALHKAIQP